MSVPDWLTREEVQAALQFSTDSPVEVKAITTKPVIRRLGGSSTLALLTADTSDGKKHFFFKTLPTDRYKKASTLMGRKFERECAMYQNVLPELLRVLASWRDRRRRQQRSTPFAPNVAYIDEYPKKYLLLEDLTQKGYRVCDSRIGLDINHCLLAIRTLARFHAASAAFLETAPDITDILKNPYELLKDKFRINIQNTFTAVANKGWDTASLRTVAKVIQDSRLKAVYSLVGAHSHKDNTLNVISHGEFWLKNLMFRYDGGEVIDVCFVDYRMSHVTSPAVDLFYFLATSIGTNVLQSWGYVLVKEYYDVLSRTMSGLDLQPPSWESLHECLKKFHILAVHSAVTVAPLARARLSPAEEEAARRGEYDFRRVYVSDGALEWLRVVVECLARCGWMASPALETTPSEGDLTSTPFTFRSPLPFSAPP